MVARQLRSKANGRRVSQGDPRPDTRSEKQRGVGYIWKVNKLSLTVYCQWVRQTGIHDSSRAK